MSYDLDCWFSVDCYTEVFIAEKISKINHLGIRIGRIEANAKGKCNREKKSITNIAFNFISDRENSIIEEMTCSDLLFLKPCYLYID